MDSNITELPRRSSNNLERYHPNMFPLIYTALAFVLLSIVSNSFTLVVLRRSDIFHAIDLILYRFLAVEDMIYSIIALTSFVIYTKVDFNTVAIPFFWYCQMPLLYQTVGAVLTISICRYLMIVRPPHYPMWVTRRRIIVSQSVLIVMSFVLACLLKLLAEWVGNIFEELSIPFVGTYIIPMIVGFLVQVFTGSHILYISIRQSRHLQRGERALFQQERRRNGSRDPGDKEQPEILQEPNRRSPGSFKGIKTVLVIIGSYWIAWFPFFMYTFQEIGLLELPDWFLILANSTALVNGCWNSLIYYLTNRAFRDTAKRTIRMLKSKLFRVCKPQTVPVVE